MEQVYIHEEDLNTQINGIYSIGIDIGSTTAKVVVQNENGETYTASIGGISRILRTRSKVCWKKYTNGSATAAAPPPSPAAAASHWRNLSV